MLQAVGEREKELAKFAPIVKKVIEEQQASSLSLAKARHSQQIRKAALFLAKALNGDRLENLAEI